MTARLSPEQKFFNKVSRHLLRQMKQSKYRGKCVYRDFDSGLKCAIGGVMPDKAYSPEFDSRGLAINELPKSVLDACGIVTRTCTNIAVALQCVHDNYDPEAWRSHLTELALTYGLTF